MTSWWSFRAGAQWRHPQGPGSTIEGLDDHPVVHVAYPDAKAYAAWAGERLPTEAEWGLAASGGHDARDYAWGQELAPGGQMLANYWQGQFPVTNLAVDGYERTSPVGAFPPNDFGIVDMIGNVWEWTSDWYAPPKPLQKRKAGTCCSRQSSGRPQGRQLRSTDTGDQDWPEGAQGRLVPLRGELSPALPPGSAPGTDD